MSTGCTILPTKIHRPQVAADALERPRAARVLEGALARPLTCVVSPAGFGKTTAVAQWASVCDKAIAWCSLDEDDADPLRFWSMAALALEEADPALDIPLSLQDVNWADAGEAHDALARLIQAAAADGAHRALVLEDVHTVQDAPLISDGLAYLLRNLPPTFHVVVTSRVPVRLSLAKLRMAGGLGELSQDDLRLTPDEQRSLFSRAGLVLGDDDAARLDAATQGWAAGCRLVELCCAEGSGAEVASALARAGDDVSAYLFEEVLGSLDAHLLDFMVKTSAVDSFSVDLAAAITGLEPFQVRERVEGLISQGLFVQRIAGADDGDWYRYHKMLLDALRANLKRLPDDDSRVCAVAARQWYLDRGFDDAAVGLSFWMRDWDALSDIIVSRWKALYMNDEQATVLRWALLLPRDYLRERPFLCAVAAMPAALAGDAVLSNELIHQALLSLKEGEDFLFAFCMVQKAFVASFNRRTDESGSFAEKALRFLPADERYLRGMMTKVAASSRWTEDPVGAVEGFREAVELQQDIGNANLTCSALANAAIFSALIGHLPDAEMLAERALALYDERERPRKPMLALAYAALAVVAYERGDLEGFARERERYRAQTASEAVAANTAELNGIAAKAAYAVGAATARDEFLAAWRADAESVCGIMPTLAMARDWCDAFHPQVRARVGTEVRTGRAGLFDLACAFCLGDDDAWERGAVLVDAVQPDDFALRVRACCLTALVAERAGRHAASRRLLREAYALSRESGLAQAFAEYAPELRPCADLLRAPEAAGEEGSACDGAILRVVDEASRPRRTCADLLTERELECLRIVADGASVAEAAEVLVVSRETVKKHLGNVYSKLGVHSKMQAVALLREEGSL